MGKVIGYIPYMGWPTLMLNDFPMLKYGMLLFMAIGVLIAKDP